MQIIANAGLLFCTNLLCLVCKALYSLNADVMECIMIVYFYCIEMIFYSVEKTFNFKNTELFQYK